MVKHSRNAGYPEVEINKWDDMRPSEIWAIGPPLADRMLQNNFRNRSVSQHKIDEYAKDMREGRWMENGNTISLDQHGLMINGQTRCHAIIQSERYIRFHVVTEHLTRDQIFSTFDIGRGRTVAQLVQMEGHPYVQLLTGTARLAWFYDKYAPNEQWSKGIVPTTTEKFEYAARLAGTEDMSYAIENSTTISARFHAGKTWWSSAVYLIKRDTEHEDKIDEFVSGVLLGMSYDSLGNKIGLTDARLTLINWFIGREAPHVLRDQRKYVAIVIKAWNMFVSGENKQLRFIDTKEKFPKPL